MLVCPVNVHVKYQKISEKSVDFFCKSFETKCKEYELHIII